VRSSLTNQWKCGAMAVQILQVRRRTEELQNKNDGRKEKTKSRVMLLYSPIAGARIHSAGQG
jgi:hypothetical protein